MKGVVHGRKLKIYVETSTLGSATMRASVPINAATSDFWMADQRRSSACPRW